MPHFRVVTAFNAFDRDYARGTILTDEDLACWEPESERNAKVDALTKTNHLEPLDAGDPEARYPETIGNGRRSAGSGDAG